MQIAWFNVLLFCVLSVGHAAFMVAIVNRIHAWPLPFAVMHRIRQLHDLLVVILPVAFAWLTGFQGPRLFSGGNWFDLPPTLLVYLVVCGAMALALPGVAIYRHIAAKNCLQLADRSTTIDIEQVLGFRPLGRGPYRIFTRFPGNEFLKLELAEKQFQHPRLPLPLDRLSILHLSDLHFTGTVDRPYFEEVVRRAADLPADLVVFTGDLLDRDYLIDWLPTTLGRLSAPLGCYFVLGNHDWNLKIAGEIRARLEELGWRSAAGRSFVVEHQGQPLVLCGSERPWMGTHPDLTSVPRGAFRILLSHTPDNINWARRHQIDLMLSGHNHGGQVRLPGFGAVYSPSIYGCHYAAGAFWEPPTLLYVSRGISGKHPLRWNCLPELTRLVLRTAVAEAGSESTALADGQADRYLQTCKAQ
jgi:predicted MPP superfamily phosphohydrolase